MAEVTEVTEGGKIYFGGTDKIMKDGRPEQNPFAFVVHGVAALLDAARGAAAPASTPTAQDTQEAGPTIEPVEAPLEPVAAAPSDQQQQQDGIPVPAVQPMHQVPPQPQQPEQPAAGGVAEPLEQPAPRGFASPIAALQGPVDLTRTPEVARNRAAASGRLNDIVDLTAEVTILLWYTLVSVFWIPPACSPSDFMPQRQCGCRLYCGIHFLTAKCRMIMQEDGDGDPVLSSYAALLARMPAPAPGSSSEVDCAHMFVQKHISCIRQLLPLLQRT